MNLRFFILSVLLILSTSALHAQTSKYAYFENRCNDGARKDEMDWLRFLFKVESCAEIVQKLSKVKSFSEIIPPITKRRFYPGSWVNEFPELVGIQFQYELSDVSRILNRKISHEFFKYLFNYDDFNIKIAEFTGGTIKRDICMSQKLSRFKTLVVDWAYIRDLENCQLNDDYWGNTNVIIVGDYIGSGKEKFAENLIGVESLAGGVRTLEKYPNIRFVGLEVWNESSVSGLVLNQNLTHLSVNSYNDVGEYIGAIAELQNLAFLGFSCMKGFDQCEKPYLKDLSFLKEMPWLKSLNLSFSGIENADSLVALTQLERLDISNNRIQKLPDFSKLQLKYLNTENNPGSKQ